VTDKETQIAADKKYADYADRNTRISTDEK